MTISITENGAGMTFTLAGEAGLRDAAGLREGLLEALRARQATVVELGGLVSATIPVIQLLLAARRDFASDGIPLVLRDGGESPFRLACQSAGLENLAGEIEP